MTFAHWWQTSGPRVCLQLAVICIGGCAALRAQPAPKPDIVQTLSIGVVIDTHPQQRSVIEFERQVVDSLRNVLGGTAAAAFVISYSDRVRLVSDWSPADAGLKDAAARLVLDAGISKERGAVLNDGLMDGLTRLGFSADGHRKGLIVIGEGNDGGSAAKFSQVLTAANGKHIPCFALLVATHRSQVGRVRQFGFDLDRLASGTGGKLYDVRTNPKLLDEAMKDVLKRLVRLLPT
jgi:hypothetical protein